MPSTEEYEALIAQLKAYTPPKDAEAKRQAAERGGWADWLTRFRIGPRSDGPQLLLWTIGLTFSCIAVGAIGGWLLGAWMGTYNEQYYRTIFLIDPADKRFDAYEVAVGLGVSQGTVAGLVCGLVLAALFYVYRFCVRRYLLSRYSPL